MQGIAEEIKEVETLSELKALYCFGQSNNNEYGDASIVPHFKAAAARLKNQKEEPMTKIQELEAQLAALKAQPAPALPVPLKVARGLKKYRLLKTDVSWSTKPQVSALMAILSAHVEVGGTLDESTIVAAMEANVAVLGTRQGGKRIWDYYKGTHCEGLMAHGNVEVV
jgi:hypothetical protein